MSGAGDAAVSAREPRKPRASAVSRTTILAALAGLVAGCEGARHAATVASPCSRAVSVATLPSLLRESSGLAASRRHAGILWTHNDSGGEPVVYALDGRGHLVGSVRVRGARNRDWEDMALGPCAAGDCLYIGDIGDNRGTRRELEIYRVPEPAPRDTDAPAERLTLGYPDGPRDAEALFVLPDTSIYIISKGRRGPVALYRMPRGATPGAPQRLVRTQVLSPNGSELYGLVTGADATPDGRWVAIRTYERLRIYGVGPGGQLAPVRDLDVSLEDAGEPQGEAVAFGRGDTIWLSSEAGPMGSQGALSRIACKLAARGGRGG